MDRPRYVSWRWSLPLNRHLNRHSSFHSAVPLSRIIVFLSVLRHCAGSTDYDALRRCTLAHCAPLLHPDTTEDSEVARGLAAAYRAWTHATWVEAVLLQGRFLSANFPAPARVALAQCQQFHCQRFLLRGPASAGWPVTEACTYSLADAYAVRDAMADCSDMLSVHNASSRRYRLQLTVGPSMNIFEQSCRCLTSMPAAAARRTRLLQPDANCTLFGVASAMELAMCAPDTGGLRPSTLPASVCEQACRATNATQYFFCNCVDLGAQECRPKVLTDAELESASIFPRSTTTALADTTGSMPAETGLTTAVVCGPLLSVLPTHYRFSPDAQYVDLSYNRITTVTPQALNPMASQIRDLAGLDLGRNIIAFVEPYAFVAVNRLRHLDLSENMLTRIDVGVFFGLTSLQSLSLASNHLTYISPATFRDLTLLRTLDLHRNALTEIYSGEENLFADLSRLAFLDLSINSIQVVAPETFSVVRDLQALNLSRNDVINLDSDMFSHNDKLTDLHLESNVLDQCVVVGVNRSVACSSCRTGTPVLTQYVSRPARYTIQRPSGKITLNSSTSRSSTDAVRIQICPGLRIRPECRMYLRAYATRISNMKFYVNETTNIPSFFSSIEGSSDGTDALCTTPDTTFLYRTTPVNYGIKEISAAAGRSTLPIVVVQDDGSVKIRPLADGAYTVSVVAAVKTSTSHRQRINLFQFQFRASIRPVFTRNPAVPWPLRVINKDTGMPHPLNDTLALSVHYTVEAPTVNADTLFLHQCSNRSDPIRYFVHVVDNPSPNPRGNASVRSLFDVDSATGDVHVHPRMLGFYQIRLFAFQDCDGLFYDTPVFAWPFRVLLGDTATDTNGPNGQNCSDTGEPVDPVLFDGAYACRCHMGYTGANCEHSLNNGTISNQNASDSDASDTARGVSSVVTAIVVLFALTVVTIQMIILRKVSDRQKDFVLQQHNFNAELPQVHAMGIAMDLTAPAGADYAGEGSSTMLPVELPRERVLLLSQIGKGTFTQLHRAMYHPPRQQGMVEFECATRVLNEDASAEAQSKFMTEALLMAQFEHPNIAAFIGVVTRGTPKMMVMQYYQQGSLRSVVQRGKRGKALPLHMCMDFCEGIAVGMQYLASRNYVHRALTARCVLIDAANRVKIADIGLTADDVTATDQSRAPLSGDTDPSALVADPGVFLALDYDSSDDESTTDEAPKLQHGDIRRGHGVYRRKLPIRWMSPEAVMHSEYSEASDVWSFGVVCFEVFTRGALPYHGWLNSYVIEQVVTKGYRLPKPLACPPLLYTDVVLLCFKDVPRQRLKFNEIVERIQVIKVILSSLPATDSTTDDCGSSVYSADTSITPTNVSRTEFSHPDVHAPVLAPGDAGATLAGMQGDFASHAAPLEESTCPDEELPSLPGGNPSSASTPWGNTPNPWPSAVQGDCASTSGGASDASIVSALSPHKLTPEALQAMNEAAEQSPHGVPETEPPP
eukprot:m.1123857 g.1123857  ORF g.1123857 m.1123857 type:complete len:1464 (-) comp24406_c2_seq18:154-4545(-)